jgi:hypothetical protein
VICMLPLLLLRSASVSGLISMAAHSMNHL